MEQLTCRYSDCGQHGYGKRDEPRDHGDQLYAGDGMFIGEACDGRSVTVGYRRSFKRMRRVNNKLNRCRWGHVEHSQYNGNRWLSVRSSDRGIIRPGNHYLYHKHRLLYHEDNNG
jgi:hypothetical protein